MSSTIKLASKPPIIRLGALDLLRFIAAFGVLLFHFLFRGHVAGDPLSTTEFGGLSSEFAKYGFISVNMFFMISGFVIPLSAEGKSFYSYATSRFIRIYPTFILCVTISFAILALAANPFFPVSISQYLSNFSLVPQIFGHDFIDGVYWTITLEVVFYFWIGLIVATGKFDKIIVPVIAVWLAVSWGVETLIDQGGLQNLLRLTLLTQYIPYFLFGTLFYQIWRNGSSLVVVGLWLVSIYLSFSYLRMAGTGMGKLYDVEMDMWALTFAGILAHLLFIGSVLYGKRIPATPMIALLGGLTYPVYLLHQNVGYTLIDRWSPMIGNWAAFFIVTGLVLLVSALIWRYFERPVHTWMRQFFKRMEPLIWHRIFPPKTQQT